MSDQVEHCFARMEPRLETLGEALLSVPALTGKQRAELALAVNAFFFRITIAAAQRATPDIEVGSDATIARNIAERLIAAVECDGVPFR